MDVKILQRQTFSPFFFNEISAYISIVYVKACFALDWDAWMQNSNNFDREQIVCLN